MKQEARAYCVGNFVITDNELMAKYVALAVPIVEKFGGKVLASDFDVHVLEGAPKPVVAVLEFPSMKLAKAFWASDEYLAVRQMRLDATTDGFLVFAEGLDQT